METHEETAAMNHGRDNMATRAPIVQVCLDECGVAK